MLHFAGFFRSRRRAGVAVAVAGLAFGVGSELLSFGWEEPSRWVPDLVVGLVFIGTGIAAWTTERGTGALLTATGFAWFAANYGPIALYWNRGTLIHLLLAYPGWRPRSRLASVGVVIGYVAATSPVWRNDVASIALSCAMVAIIVRDRAGTAGRARRHKTVALQAGVALVLALVVGAAARLTVPAGNAVLPALWLYEGVLSGLALALYAGTRRNVAPAVTDLVVELGEAPSGTLRDALAHTLGDRSLQIGYWQPSSGDYINPAGKPVLVPADSGDRSARLIDRGGNPFAVLIHDPAILDDPALVDAVDAATRLAASNAALHDEVRARLADVAASRRRLVIAADEERRRLEMRLRDGPQKRLMRLSETVRTQSVLDSRHVRRARSQLDQTIDELGALGRGLHPRELADGLAVALRALADRASVPVRLAVADDRYPAEVEAAVYYVCAEALANVSKHAAASSVTIEVARQDRRLAVVIQDNGGGGADPSRGSGLAGLADRIEALGGRLTVESRSDIGTCLTVDIPLGGNWAPVGPISASASRRTRDSEHG